MRGWPCRKKKEREQKDDEFERSGAHRSGCALPTSVVCLAETFDHVDSGQLSLARVETVDLRRTKLIRRGAPRIAERDQPPRRVVRRGQRSLGGSDRQYLPAAHPLDRHALTFHGQHPVFFVKDFPVLRLHTEIGCRILPEGLPLNCEDLCFSRLDTPLGPYSLLPLRAFKEIVCTILELSS